jgi:PIN domain nuclease of toxin-antitoxin system
MTDDKYLFDTHALYFWNTKQFVTEDFVRFFDAKQKQGKVLVSPICFWEIAFLSRKGKVEIQDVKE